MATFRSLFALLTADSDDALVISDSTWDEYQSVVGEFEHIYIDIEPKENPE